MAPVARTSPLLLAGGGAVMVALLLAMTIDPESPAIYGFFVVAPAIGVGVLGAHVAAGENAGRLGRVSAWLAGIGGILVVIVGSYAIATGQFVVGAGVGDDDPLAIPFMLTSSAWMVGSLGFALALVRSRMIPPLGGWLVLAGTVLAIGLGTLLGVIAPELSPLSAVLFGVGWCVVGWNTRAAGWTTRAAG